MDHGEAADPPMGHVHGLVFDTAADTIVVATHTGLVAIPSGGGGHHDRIGASFVDIMGIASFGPGHLIGSGHPDVAGMGDGLPGYLGLIESTDGGATWSPVSLAGEADLHAIAVTRTVTYAWDAVSGAVMATSDLREWETLSTFDVSALAADPADADVVVAASPGGTVETTDGGRTWVQDDGAPALTVLTWTNELGLIGTTQDGAVWGRGERSRWEALGLLPGTPTAIVADGGSLFAATESPGGGIAVYRSDDGGGTWGVIYSNPDD